MFLLSGLIIFVILISVFSALEVSKHELKCLKNGKIKRADENTEIKLYDLYEIHFISFLLFYSICIGLFYSESLVISYFPMNIFIKIFFYLVIDYLWEQKRIRKYISSEDAFLSAIGIKNELIFVFLLILTILQYSMIW